VQAALVGLSQSGKSTLFRAVTEGHVHVGAGTAHQVDKAVVKVPDERVERLVAALKPKKTTYATIEFLDLPGLSFVEESGRHEARRIVAQARQADMLMLVVRAFGDEGVAANRGRVDPAQDLAELRTELALADLEMVANRIDKLEKASAKPTPHVEEEKRELALLQRCGAALENLEGLRSVIGTSEDEKLVRSFGFLSLKPVLVVVNVGEESLGQASPLPAEGAGGAATLVLSAKWEAELAALAPEERTAFLQDLGVQEIARDRLVQACYRSLNVISFLTYASEEVRAWTVPAGGTALEAAGAIHSDMQRGFIRAETVHWSDFAALGDFKALKSAGKMHLEGKTYVVQDGDIITFRFNV